MDIVQLYRDYNIQFLTEGHKHCRPGWVNTPCPFCTGNPGYHLGVSEDGSHFYCWRCGSHRQKEALSKLLNVSEKQVIDIIRNYAGTVYAPEKKRKIRNKAHKMPGNITPLLSRHKEYLESRNFDAKQLEKDWGLVGTGVISLLDGIDYKNRIIAPVFWNGSQVTFQGRDITGRHPLKYMACPENREIIKHKSILYGRQEYWGETGICVEGITDVWRLGFNAFATFGIEYKFQQVREMAKHFKRVAVAFDDDPQAIRQAEKLVADLCFRGVDAFRIPIVGDPGGMDQMEADYLVNNLIPKIY